MSILLQTIAAVAPIVPKLPFWEVTGAAGLVVILLWIIYLFVTKISQSKKKDATETQFEMIKQNLKDLKDEVNEIGEKGQNTRSNLDVFKAHYESEERFKKNIEKRIEKMEKVIYGNGQKSIMTRIELLERDVENLDKIKNVRKRTT